MKRFQHDPLLRRNLATIIVLKILFLTLFWQLVLKHEATLVDTRAMSERLLPSTHDLRK